MKLLKIEKTGNFWVDNGIIGLYRTLFEIEVPNISYHIEKDGLLIEYESDSSLIDALNEAKSKVVAKYLHKTGNYGWIFKEETGFELYERTDFKMYLKSFFTANKPKTEGALVAPGAKDGDAVKKGRIMTERELQLFKKFKEEISEKLIDSKRIKIEDKGYLNSAPQYDLGLTFDGSLLQPGKKFCTFSGKYYRKAKIVTGIDYPFLTSKSGELNFASYLEEKPLLSSLYSFIALFAFSNIKYLMQGDMKHYFVLNESNLASLSEFLNAIEPSPEQIDNSNYCNFKTELVGTVYESEALFNFLLSIYSQLKLNFELDKYKEELLYSKSVFTLSNDGNIFRDVREYTSISALFNLFDSLANSDSEHDYFVPFKWFVTQFTQKLDGGKYNSTWRDTLCHKILNFNSITQIVESFLGEVKIKEEKGSIPFLDKILLIYNSKLHNNMNTEIVKLCHNIGINIGIYAYTEKDRSSLYSLRNAKSRVEFLKALELIQFRIMESVKMPDQYKTKNYMEFFNNLPEGRDWEEMKSMVSIFAMNSYLYEKQKESSINQSAN